MICTVNPPLKISGRGAYPEDWELDISLRIEGRHGGAEDVPLIISWVIEREKGVSGSCPTFKRSYACEAGPVIGRQVRTERSGDPRDRKLINLIWTQERRGKILIKRYLVSLDAVFPTAYSPFEYPL